MFWFDELNHVITASVHNQLPAAQGPFFQEPSASIDGSATRHAKLCLPFQNAFVATVNTDQRIIAPTAVSQLEIRRSARVASVRPIAVPPHRRLSQGWQKLSWDMCMRRFPLHLIRTLDTRAPACLQLDLCM